MIAFRSRLLLGRFIARVTMPSCVLSCEIRNIEDTYINTFLTSSNGYFPCSFECSILASFSICCVPSGNNLRFISFMIASMEDSPFALCFCSHQKAKRMIAEITSTIFHRIRPSGTFMNG